jgi:hypothetical protein
VEAVVSERALYTVFVVGMLILVLATFLGQRA